MKKGSVTVDGVTKTVSSGTLRTTKNVYFGACDNNGSAWRHCIAKFRRFRIWKAGALIRDFVPLRKADDYGAFLDLVTGAVYNNSGTTRSALIAGPKWDGPYRRVQYLQVSGSTSNFCNTPLNSGNGAIDAIEIDLAPTAVGVRNFLCSANATSAYDYIEINANNKFKCEAIYDALTVVKNQMYTVRLDGATNKMYVNGVDTGVPISGAPDSGMINKRTCRLAGTAQDRYYGQARYYAFRMYKGSELKMNWVPVVGNTYGYLYFYDTVMNGIYTVSGTWTAGPDLA